MRLKTHADLHQQLLESVTTTDPGQCWIWTKSITHSGYGQVGARLIRKSPLPAHRLAFMLLVGPIPEGYELHHTCGQRPCCNPAHLQLLTKQEHRDIHGHDQRRTHCVRGHEYSITPRGKRVCRHCDAARNRRNRRRAVVLADP